MDCADFLHSPFTLKIRAQRQKIKLLKDGGADEDDIIIARGRYRGLSQEYAQFSKAMDLPQQRERIYGDGLGDVGKGKYTVAKSENSGIIEMYRGKEINVNSDSDISPKTIKQVKKATKKVTSDFKILERYSEPISFGNIEDGLAYNNYDPNTGLNKITLSKNAFSNPNELLKKLKTDFDSGVSYETDTIQSLVAHEMGHNAHVALTLKRVSLPYGVPLTHEQTMVFDVEYLKIRNEIYEYVFGNDLDSDIILDKICGELGNSAVVGNELISQGFGCYYYGNNKSKIANKVVEYFKKELK